MEITVDIVREKFKEYNKKFFNNELIMPEIRLLKSYLTCGYFSCKKIIGKRRLRGQRLEISCYYDWNENDLKNVIIHEMIHYYLAYKHIDNELSHGDAFIKMSKEFNEKFDTRDNRFINFIGDDIKCSVNRNNVLFYTIELIRIEKGEYNDK